MARTFTYDKRNRSRQQPPQQSSRRNTTQATIKRGKYADIADRVRDHRRTILNRITDQASETAERQKRTTSP